MIVARVALLLIASSAVAETEIYRCAQEDGSFAFSQLPCIAAEPQPEASDEPPEPADEFASPYDDPEYFSTQPEASFPEPVSEDRAECEKLTRDAIDAIDLEMRETDFTPEEGRAYLARLRELTWQLRACKRL